jgi:hypothetical protein
MPIVASAVLVFVASSLIWNVLGAHKWHVKGLPDEAGAREAIGKQGLAAGQYAIPYSAGPAAMKDPAFKEKLEKGPVAVLVIRKPGLPNMAEFLGAWFAYLLFVSYVVAFVCGQTLARGTPYMLVFRVAGRWPSPPIRSARSPTRSGGVGRGRARSRSSATALSTRS